LIWIGFFLAPEAENPPPVDAAFDTHKHSDWWGGIRQSPLRLRLG
jgi:glyoxylase-like metal-dependent hydrolase (beta-lactamase superfamily II)